MPAVGMWQAGVAVAWTIGVIPTSKSSAGHPLLVVGLPTIAITGSSHKKKKEGEECSQERKKRWRDRGTERGMKAGSVVTISSLSKVCPLIAQSPHSPSLSLCLLPLISLFFLGKALAEKIFMNSWACRRCWGCLKTCQFNSCVYGLGPG